MITEPQFLKAVETVKLYQAQVNKIASCINNTGKTNVIDWCDRQLEQMDGNGKQTTRLLSCMKSDFSATEEKRKVCIEDVTVEYVRRIKNLGPACVNEFKRLRGIAEKKQKTPLGVWIKKQEEVSVRLCNALNGAFTYLGIEYIEDLDINEFLKCPNVGRRSQKELLELREREK